MPPETLPKDIALPELDAAEQGASLWSDAWHRLAKNKLAIAGLWIVGGLSVLCFLGPLSRFVPTAIRPVGLSYSYQEQNLDSRVTPPNARHWLGTDQLGRDLLSRILFGGRVSLMVGLFATAVSLTIGVLYGAIAGYLGGKLDTVMMRIVDILYSLPLALFVILLMVFVGRSIVLIFVAIGAVEWLTMARIVRGQTLSIKRREFIEAALAGGVSTAKIIRRHIIPNSVGPVIVYVTLTIPQVILIESFLSFLGLGVQEPYTSWGVLISEGAAQMETAPWMLVFPAIFLAATLFCFNFIGDGLRDALDPKDH